MAFLRRQVTLSSVVEMLHMKKMKQRLFFEVTIQLSHRSSLGSHDVARFRNHLFITVLSARGEQQDERRVIEYGLLSSKVSYFTPYN